MFPRGWVTGIELCELSSLLRGLDGETRMVMEATRSYHLPMAKSLYDSGFYVSVVNAILVHGYGNNSLWRAKTDKKDALKLANYASTIGWHCLDTFRRMKHSYNFNQDKALDCHRQ